MEKYALSIANYFVLLSQQDELILRPLKLVKLVYIAHGYLLALFDLPTEEMKHEPVEAWSYGPVFPSVYYSFKDYGNGPITRMTMLDDFSKPKKSGGYDRQTPLASTRIVKAVCEFVWKKYAIYTDATLVAVLHAPDTPWSRTYKEGEKAIIPDSLTKAYYRNMIDETLKSKRHEQRELVEEAV